MVARSGSRGRRRRLLTSCFNCCHDSLVGQQPTYTLQDSTSGIWQYSAQSATLQLQCTVFGGDLAGSKQQRLHSGLFFAPSYFWFRELPKPVHTSGFGDSLNPASYFLFREQPKPDHTSGFGNCLNPTNKHTFEIASATH